MKVVVAIGGASGSVYAKRLLDALVPLASTVEVGLVFTQAGNEVWNHEIGEVPAYPFKKYGLRDFRAPFASGSAGWDAMVVIPCSTGGLARMLVLVVRETPLSAIHLENMLAVTRAGAVVLPASPSFYSKPANLDSLLDTVVGRVLDQVGLPNKLMPRWGEGQGEGK